MTHPQEEIETVKVNPDDLRAIAEKRIVDQFGHVPDAGYGDDMLAHRVLEFPDTGDNNWYVASAVTLAAGYIALLDELDGLKARVESAEKALAPLIVALKADCCSNDEEADNFWSDDESVGLNEAVTFGMIRRASAHFTKHPEGKI